MHDYGGGNNADQGGADLRAVEVGFHPITCDGSVL